MKLPLPTRFDTTHKRYFLNDQLSVLHCHHYATLYTQLALDAKETILLAEVAEDTFLTILKDYFLQHAIQTISERVELACHYFSEMGLGKMQINYLTDYTGEIELLSSHLDEGWLKKWGKHDVPINYITAGFCAAMFESILNQPARAFSVKEIQSIVMGAETSLFKIDRRTF
ncbi:MAG: hypothetical protein RIT27_733 [Pseudomonadota bacterium]|jgi:predicted hydrocarbon binding protein